MNALLTSLPRVPWKWIYGAAMGICLSMLSFAVTADIGKPGTLDPTWGANSPLGPGKVALIMGGGGDATSAAHQTDRKVVISGNCWNGTREVFCAMRLNVDGTPDVGFGNAGRVMTTILNEFDNAHALHIQPDGKILQAGICFDAVTNNHVFCAVRYLTNGELDTTFGTSGKLITQMEVGYNAVNAIAQRGDGGILLVGTCSNDLHFCIALYDINGVLDASFGNAGRMVGSHRAQPARANAVALQTDGKIVLAGDCYNGRNWDFCTMRYRRDGSLDTDFGGLGEAITPIGQANSGATAINLQPDGKILAAGFCVYSNLDKDDFCALRYTQDGMLDDSFGASGVVVTPMGSDLDRSYAIALQPDGYILLGGYCYMGFDRGYDFCMARYKNDGSLDTSFGSGGKVFTTFSYKTDASSSMILQRDGKIILAGGCGSETNTNTYFCAARYDGGPFGYRNCSLDIDGDGVHTATIDGLIMTRVMMGFAGDNVINGISFAAHASRNTWPLIREHLISQCGMSIQ